MSGGKKAESEEAAAKKKFSRRDFLVTGGTVVAVDALIATTPAKAVAATSPSPAAVKYPASKGYLVYDSKKCIGCTTCMLSCSLTHYGVQSLSLARIQIMQDSFGKFPTDLKMAPCRQCVTPPCVINCPVGAAYIDEQERQRSQDRCQEMHRLQDLHQDVSRSSRTGLSGIRPQRNHPSATCASKLPTGMKRADLEANRPVWRPAR